MPKSYFDAAGESLVTVFREAVLTGSVSGKPEDLMEGFPEAALVATLQRTWHSAARTIYRNWLRYMVSRKEDMPKLSAPTVVHENGGRKSEASPAAQISRN
jgi:hypothetical protein